MNKTNRCNHCGNTAYILVQVSVEDTLGTEFWCMACVEGEGDC